MNKQQNTHNPFLSILTVYRGIDKEENMKKIKLYKHFYNVNIKLIERFIHQVPYETEYQANIISFAPLNQEEIESIVTKYINYDKQGRSMPYAKYLVPHLTEIFLEHEGSSEESMTITSLDYTKVKSIKELANNTQIIIVTMKSINKKFNRLIEILSLLFTHFEIISPIAIQHIYNKYELDVIK